MGALLFDAEKTKSLPSDSFSRFLTSFFVKISGANELNKLTSSLKSDFSDPSFASEIFEINKIFIDIEGFNIPKSGSFIVLFPVISGLVEALSAIVSVIEQSGRNDIKLLALDSTFSKIDAFQSCFLPYHSGSFSSQILSAIKHLNRGGGVIYLQRFSFNSNQIGFKTLDVPLRLSKLTQSPLIPAMVDFDPFLFNSLSYFFGEWCYTLFSIRRFLSFKNVKLSISFATPVDLSLDVAVSVNKLEHQYKLSIHKDNVESLITLPFALLIQFKNDFVPRGTKR